MTTKNFKIPNFRLPCLKKGDLSNTPLTNFPGQDFILCCLPHLTEKETWLLEAHAKEVEKADGTFAVLLHRNFPSSQSWVRPLHKFDFPIFVDPMKRLRRSLRLLHTLPLQRCESLIFDHHRFLKFRVFHDFNLRGLATMLTIAKADKVPSTQISNGLKYLHLYQNNTSGFSPLHQNQSKLSDPLSQSVHPERSEICA